MSWPPLPEYPGLGSAGGILRGLGYSVKWSPVFFNQSVKALNGASIDIGLASSPLHNFELVYDFLRDYGGSPSELRQLWGFYVAMQGSLGRFQFFNPDDNTVIGQLIGTGNGTQTVFPVVRSFGNAFTVGMPTETVGIVDTSGTYPLNVSVNGSLVASYPASAALISGPPGAPILTLASAPGSGQPVNMDFTYWYFCRFAEDSLTFEKFVDKVWSSQSVKIQSCRAGA